MPSPESVALALRRIARRAVLRRTENDVNTDVTVWAMLRGGTPVTLVGGLQQAQRTITISVQEIADTSWPGPPRDNDLIQIDGAWMTQQGPADARYVGARLAFYVINLRG
jgi:hypothetical protein